MRIRGLVRSCQFGLICLLIPGARDAFLNAQTARPPYLSSNSSAVTNPYSFAIEVLVAHPSGVGYDQYRVVRAEAGATVSLNLPAGSGIVMFIPLDAHVASARAPKCATAATPFTRWSRSLAHEEIAIADRGGVDSEGVKQQERIAEEQGALEFAQNMDVMNTQLHDPVAAELRRENYRDADPKTRAQMDQQDHDTQVNTVVASVAYLAAANSDFLFEHDYAAEQESGQLGKMVESKQQLVDDLQRKYNETQTRVKANVEFQRESAAEMRRGLGGAATQIAGAHEVARVCSGAANDQDLFALNMEAPAVVNILIGEAKFDKGGNEDLVFRRIRGTSEWTATAYWPTEANQATLSLASGGGWTKIGSVDAGRPSIKKQLDGAQQAINQLKSRKRSADYSSQGGDESRTTVIP